MARAPNDSVHVDGSPAREVVNTGTIHDQSADLYELPCIPHRGNAMDGGKIDEPLSLKEKHLTRKF